MEKKKKSLFFPIGEEKKVSRNRGRIWSLGIPFLSPLTQPTRGEEKKEKKKTGKREHTLSSSIPGGTGREKKGRAAAAPLLTFRFWQKEKRHKRR